MPEPVSRAPDTILGWVFRSDVDVQPGLRGAMDPAGWVATTSTLLPFNGWSPRNPGPKVLEERGLEHSPVTSTSSPTLVRSGNTGASHICRDRPCPVT